MSKTKKATKEKEEPKGRKRPEVIAIEKDLEKYIDLEKLADSAGGKIVVDNLAKDILSTAESLGNRYKTATHAELMSLCADLESKWSILRLITRAKKNKELAEVALREALAEDPELNEG